MRPSNPPLLLWVDLETTGLDPLAEDAAILEVAFVLTEINLLEYWSFDTAMLWTGLTCKLHPAPRKMHTDSGLFERCKLGSSVAQVSAILHGALADHAGNRKVVLAGSSIGGFDKPYMKQHAPEWLKGLHYRMCDVSSLYPFFESLGIDSPDDPKPHGAAEDIRRSIYHYSHFRRIVSEGRAEQRRDALAYKQVQNELFPQAKGRVTSTELVSEIRKIRHAATTRT